jgi:hypothetical protein
VTPAFLPVIPILNTDRTGIPAGDSILNTDRNVCVTSLALGDTGIPAGDSILNTDRNVCVTSLALGDTGIPAGDSASKHRQNVCVTARNDNRLHRRWAQAGDKRLLRPELSLRLDHHGRVHHNPMKTKSPSSPVSKTLQSLRKSRTAGIVAAVVGAAAASAVGTALVRKARASAGKRKSAAKKATATRAANSARRSKGKGRTRSTAKAAA